MKLLDTNQVAKRFGVSRQTVLRWLKDGHIPKPFKHWGWLKWDESQFSTNSAEPMKVASNDTK